MAHPLQFTPSHQRRKRERKKKKKKKKKTQNKIGVDGFRSALDHGWVASARRGYVSSWGVGGRRCSWLAVGRGSGQIVVGRGSDRPLLHLAATASGYRLHKRNPEITGLSSTCVATRSGSFFTLRRHQQRWD